MPKKGLLILLAGAMFAGFVLGDAAQADEGEKSVAVFVRDDCRHCQDEKEFLDQLQQEMPQLKVEYLGLSNDDNRALFNQVTEHYGLAKATPITLIGTKLVPGYGKTETTGKLFRDLLAQQEAPSSFGAVASGGATVVSSSEVSETCDELEGCQVSPSYLVSIPLLGKTVDAGSLSLTAMSLTLGFIDGFNPCALWVLVMFLVLLSQVGSKKRMWQYAGLFIVAEAIMYYLILMVWFTVWDFVALDQIVTPLVGWLALGGGIYFLHKFITFKPVCDVSSLEQQQKMQNKAKRLVDKPLTLLSALGIIGLAFSVNVFEFACSIGIPQVFTKVLEMNELTTWVRQMHVSQYILAYMMDDLLVFGIALFSLDKLGMTAKYSRWSTLVGGILMIALGLIMILTPQWLVF